MINFIFLVNTRPSETGFQFVKTMTKLLNIAKIKFSLTPYKKIDKGLKRAVKNL